MTREGWWLLAAAGLLATLACAPPPAAPAVPSLPDLEGVEPAVREKIERSHGELQRRPDDAGAWGLYARTLHAHRMRAEARTAYHRAAALAEAAGGDPFPHRYLAGKALLRESPAQAVADLERAVALRGGDPAARLGLAQAYERTGQPGRAAEQYREALAVGAGAHARFGLGRLALAAGRLDEAIEEMERAAALIPEHSGVQALLAQAYGRAGRDEDARRAAAAARGVGESPPYPDPWMQQVLAESASAKSFIDRAIAEFQQQRFAEALQSVDRALEQAPEHAGALYIRGTILGRTGRCAEALDVFARAVAANPDHLDARVRRAQCLAELGRAGEARRELRALLQRDPGHAAARAMLARLE